MTSSLKQSIVYIGKSIQQEDLQNLFNYFAQQNVEDKQKNIHLKQQYNKNNIQNYLFDNENNNIYQGCLTQQNQNYIYQIDQNYSHDGSNNESNQNKFITYNSYNLGHKKLNRINQKSNFSYSQKINDQRSLNALISNKKRQKIKQNSDSVRSSINSQFSNVSKHNLKFTNKKNQNQKFSGVEQHLFINPLTTSHLETMNLRKIKKLISMNYQQLLQKAESIHKNMIRQGQKLFFKSKQNQEQIDNLFSLMGLKISRKLGKSKTFREFKAIYSYLQFTGIQKQQQSQVQKGIELLEKTYMNQFKQLMGYQKGYQKFQNRLKQKKHNLLSFGFSTSAKKENQQ